MLVSISFCLFFSLDFFFSSAENLCQKAIIDFCFFEFFDRKCFKECVFLRFSKQLPDKLFRNVALGDWGKIQNYLEMACGSYSSSNYSSLTSTYWYGTSSSSCRSCYCPTRLSWRSSSYRLSTTLRHSSTYWNSTSGWCTSSNKLPAAGWRSSNDWSCA